MELSKKQFRKFQRIHKKHPVSIEFLEYNFRKIIKELKFYTNFRFVLKRKLIERKNHRVFIQYNVPNKQNLSKYKKCKQFKSRHTMSWSKRIVMYKKKMHLLDKIKEQTNEISNSDSQNDIELNLTPDEIQKQLKTQLELLKGGKRFQPSINRSPTSSSAGTSTPKLLTSNPDITKRLSLDRKSSFGGGGGGSSCSSFEISLKDAREAGPSNMKRIHDVDVTDSSSSVDQFNDFIQNSNNSSMIERNSSNIVNIDSSNDNSKCLNDSEPVKKQQQKSVNFIDSLINKINSTKDKNPDRNSPNEINELPKISVTDNLSVAEKTITKSIEQQAHEEDSLSSGEFLGFPDVEIIPSNVPGMLPTPVVPRKLSSTQSAFVSEDLDKFMRDNLLDNITTDDNTIDKLPKLKRYEDGLVFKGAVPPKLKMASLPTELQKPRTLAEKRILLQKNKNIKYLMIENENTIYHELKKRSRDCNVNITLIKSLQKQSLPATRDFWKATSWLLTQNGKFYFQIANIDGIECKLIGGYGNNLNKNLPIQFSYPIKKELKRLPQKCQKNCMDRISYKNIKIRYSNKIIKDSHKIHLVNNVKETINNCNKPGPLSSKCLHLSYMPNYGPPEIYRMPKIQLEVFPQINRPLDDVCKSYLKMILPSKNITKEWAEFAVSTLILPKTIEEQDDKLSIPINYTSFTFNIPYLNDQKNILVRRVYNRKERFDKITTDDLQFRKIANKSKDPITLECANILSEMIDSVAIGLSEDSLIKNDPDIDYEHKIIENANLKTAENQISSKANVNLDKKADKKTNKKSKLMLELKRLNATIIDAGGPGYDEKVTEVCTKAYCRLGCVCMSLSGPPSLKKHCKKVDCMVECNCIGAMVERENDSNSCITSQDALMLRQKATARLARMEREFCSTVVLTNTETLLINESQYERKRRCTKRYLNYTYDSEIEPINKDDSTQQPPLKRQRTNKIKAIVTEAKLQQNNDFVYVDEIIMDKLKHCEVNLIKLEYLENIEKWCMVHCLYKCFCKTKDLIGKPFILKKDEVNEKSEIIYSRKAIYSFDKNEETSLKIVNNNNKNEKSKLSVDKLKSNISITKTKKPLLINNDELLKERLLVRKYFEFNANNCRRLLQIPSTYQSRNKRYALAKRRGAKYYNFIENAKTNLLLTDRIRNSILYRPTRTVYIPKNIISPNHKPNTNNNNNNNNSTNEIESQFLKISSVVSLNPSPVRINTTNILQNSSLQSDVQTQSLLTNTTTDLLQTSSTDLKKLECGGDDNGVIDSQNIHKNVLKLLNYLVTKTMHNICKIQVDESKNIPNPVADTLHISQWRYFLQAYIEGIIHIWEVKVNNNIYFTGTMQNIMPFIHNAISVVNIKAIRKENLPLFGKMLNAKVINQHTSSLSILMAGHNDYWRILGMTNSTIDYIAQGGVIKPTPQSHPWLSTKINTLYEIMAKQRIDKILTKQQKTSTNTNNNNEEIQQQANVNEEIEQKSQQEIDPTTNDYDDIKKNFIINTNTSNNNNAVDRLLKMNIKIRQLTQREITQDKFTIPLGSATLDYRWLVLDIVDDFSHILFVEQMECLTHNKIKIAFQRSYTENKMVRLAKVDSKNIDCYVMKNDKNRIYLGPFELNCNPEIVLYQNIDGKMMLREDFEKVHNIKRTISTTGFWLCRKNGKIIFDISKSITKGLNNTNNPSSSTTIDCSNKSSSTNVVKQSNTENRKSKNLQAVETIVIDQEDDTDFDGNSNGSSLIFNNSTTINSNLQIHDKQQPINIDSNNSEVKEKLINSNDNNLPTPNNVNSLQNINNKISNNRIIIKSPLINTNTKIIDNSTINLTNSNKSILKKTHIQQIILNNPENNTITQPGLISLNPGVYEITNSENLSETKKSLIKTTNDASLLTATTAAAVANDSQSAISSKNMNNDKNLLLKTNNLLSKTDGKLIIGENINNIMVAKKSTTSAALNPNTIRTKYIPRKILPKSDRNSINYSEQSKQMKSYQNNSIGIISNDNTKSPIITNVCSLPNVPAFIKITSLAKSFNTITPTSSTIEPPVTENLETTENLSNRKSFSNLSELLKITHTTLPSNSSSSTQNSQKNIEKSTPIVKPVVKTTSELKNFTIDISQVNSTSNGYSLSNHTADIKRPRTITGYFMSNIREYPKFGGIKRDPIYLIKSSSNSALQLRDLTEVTKFLNSHVRKHSAAFKPYYKNVTWSFVPYKKSNTSPSSMTKITEKQFHINTLANIKSSRKDGENVAQTNKTDANQTAITNDVIVIDDED